MIIVNTVLMIGEMSAVHTSWDRNAACNSECTETRKQILRTRDSVECNQALTIVLFVSLVVRHRSVVYTAVGCVVNQHANHRSADITEVSI